MRIFYRVLCLLFLLVSSSLFSSEKDGFAGWTHLELGAGNYGSTWVTKSVSENVANAIASEKGGVYYPEGQYGVLFWTLNQLVERYGEVGVFHVNDYFEDYALFATQNLTEYAAAKGYESVIIEAVHGDYRSKNFSEILEPYERTKYDSIHLKNPEPTFYRQGKKTFTVESRSYTRELLQYLADLSEEGLYLFTLYTDHFVPPEEKEEFIDTGIFYQETTEWETVPYISRLGKVRNDSVRLFFIESQADDKE